MSNEIEVLSGWQHYQQAEIMIAAARELVREHADPEKRPAWVTHSIGHLLAEAQVHASLAGTAHDYVINPGLYALEEDGRLHPVPPALHHPKERP